MIEIEQFKEMCRQPGIGKVYYRPLICKGEISNVGIFFIGTNPATPKFSEEIEAIKILLLKV